MRKPFLAVLALCLVAVAALAQPPSASTLPLSEDQIEKIERLIASEMSRQSIPGVSVAIARGEQVIWQAGFGLADVENYIPARPQTVYRTGSIAKTITAVALMTLVESRKLDLDAPVDRYLGDWPLRGKRITARMLLSHTAGIRNYRSNEERDNTRHYATMREALGLFANDALLSEPGAKYHYTSYDFTVLGAVIERITGGPVMDLLQRTVLQPAGMVATQDDSVSRLIPRRSRGYRRTRNGGVENCALADTSYKVPGGGLVTSVEDLLRYALALQRGTLLPITTVRRMWTPQKTRDGNTLSYGLGWSISATDGRERIGHDGNSTGVGTALWMLPSEGLTLAILTNLEGAQMTPMVTVSFR